MLLFLLSYLGGLLSILSPCILPVLPFVFAKTGEPFRRSGLPLLGGMALTFAVVSTLAAIGGTWAVRANEWGRAVAIVLLAFFGLSLIFPSIFEALSQPLVRLGGRLSRGSQGKRGILQAFTLGIATGFLWAPCAGPILGLILTAAALQGASVTASVLFLAYALGAGTSLAVALMAGDRLLRKLRRYLGADIWIRRIIGSAVLIGVLAIIMGWDRGILSQLSRPRTESIEQNLLDTFRGKSAAPKRGQQMPELEGATQWINSEPLTREKLKGKVVLIDFWTYSCINCLRTLPYLRAWAEKYKASGLVVIGVHSPEFAFEKSEENVRKAVRDLKITYPIAVDSNYAIWRAYDNHYWPAHYFIDRNGVVRRSHFGEGEYEESEKLIQELLREMEGSMPPSTQEPVHVEGAGAEAPPLMSSVASPETYLGHARAQNLVVTPALRENQATEYTPAGRLKLNQWTLAGNWKITEEHSSLEKAPGRIRFRFRARDLHLVLGPGAGGRPLRFRVTLDGIAPGKNRGVDIDPSGNGTVTEHRLYQLIRQAPESLSERTFEIEFLDSGVEAYAFTFG